MGAGRDSRDKETRCTRADVCRAVLTQPHSAPKVKAPAIPRMPAGATPSWTALGRWAAWSPEREPGPRAEPWLRWPLRGRGDRELLRGSAEKLGDVWEGRGAAERLDHARCTPSPLRHRRAAHDKGAPCVTCRQLFSRHGGGAAHGACPRPQLRDDPEGKVHSGTEQHMPGDRGGPAKGASLGNREIQP